MVTAAPPRRLHALTVDVEEAFQVSAFEGVVSRADWEAWPSRVEANVARVLELLAAHDVRATFFILGWIARRHPALVRRIGEAGHEIGSHGHDHMLLSRLSPDAFWREAHDTRQLLADLSGQAVLGFRATSFSINRETAWAWDLLSRAGYLYSSSVYPVRHDLYGMPEAPRHAFWAGGDGGLLEIPVSTFPTPAGNLPCGGGGFFRLYPYALSRFLLSRLVRSEQEPLVFYFHPWELDPAQPVVAGLSRRSHFRHYLNLARMENRLSRLLSDFAWDRMDRVFAERQGG